MFRKTFWLEKQKFRRGRIDGAKAAMKDYGTRKLRVYTSQPQVKYHYYYNFEAKRNLPNFQIPPHGRAVRVTDLKGEPIVLTRRRVRGDKFR